MIPRTAPLLLSFGMLSPAFSAPSSPPPPAASAPRWSESERFVYVNGQLAGLFSVCVEEGGTGVALSTAFFEQLRLLHSPTVRECGGHAYYSARVAFTRNDAAGTVSAQARPDDYAHAAKAPAAPPPPPAPVRLVPTLAVAHDLSVLRGSDGRVGLGLGLALRHFSRVGLFDLEGTLSVDQGPMRWVSSELGWRRHFPAWGLDAGFGVATLGAAGAMQRVRGLRIGTDEDQARRSASRSLEGFADVPGRLAIRSGGQLLREVMVDAGPFSIPVATLPSQGRTGGQYSLSLQDSSGRTVRRWDVFVPADAQLLRAGAWVWQAFAGALDVAPARHPLSEHGVGLTGRYGWSGTTSLEAFGALGPRHATLGALVAHAPTSWLLASLGGAGTVGAAGPAAQWFGHLGLQGDTLGASADASGFPCAPADSADGATQAPAAVSTPCRSLQLGLSSGGLDAFGRLALQLSWTLNGAEVSRGETLGWTPRALGPVDLSVTFSQQAYAHARSRTLTLILSVPLGHGEVSATGSFAGPARAIALDYQQPLGPELQGAARVGQGDPGQLSMRGSLLYSPWYGSGQLDAEADAGGQWTLGASTHASLLWVRGEWLAASPSDEGYAVVHLAHLPEVSIDDANGRRRAVTNADGWAALPVARGDEGAYRVAPDDLGPGREIDGPVVGTIRQSWQASLWEPRVRRVNRGWIRLLRPDGQVVPLGATFRFAGQTDELLTLDGGDVYVDDLPERGQRVLVHFPGDIARCSFAFPDGLRLQETYGPDRPEFRCVTQASP